MLLSLFIFWWSLGLSKPQVTNYECGRATPQGAPLVVGGLPAGRGELPWHAGVYRKTSRPYRQICGGTIVSRTLVISAAHCFWDGQLQPAADFAVAAGKLYRPWDVARDTGAQRTDVKEILVPELFRGEDRNFAEDIALLVLAAAFRFRPYLRAVCLDFDPRFEEDQLFAGSLGKVAGWGFTAADGAAAAALQVAELPFVPQVACLQQSPKTYWEYLTHDKICAGVGDGQRALCQGDSGGGLVFPQAGAAGAGVERYYLRGVVSTSPSATTLCNTYAITSFTKVSKFRSFIELRFNPALDNALQLSDEDSTSPPETHCELPPRPEHGNFTANSEWWRRPGPGGGGNSFNLVLNYFCDPGWLLEGDPVGVCALGVWRGPFPKCISAEGVQGCVLDAEDPSVEYRCGERACRRREPAGTRATARCRTPDFIFGDATLPDQAKRMVCLENSSWDRFPFCERECGRVTPQGAPLVEGARRARPGDFPWHVAVYELAGALYRYRCGGTLLSRDIVITAAHCFWDESRDQLAPVQRFGVSGAKVHKDWYAPQDGSAQRSEIDRVAVPEGWRGAAGGYAGDLALAFLARPFRLKPSLRPACLDFAEPEPGASGYLSGLGKADDNTEAAVVSSVRLPLLAAAAGACRARLAPARRAFVAADMFCAGYDNGNALCGAGAGGGLTFPLRDHSGVERHRLRGVAVGLAEGAAGGAGGACPAAAPTFVSLAKHERFIREDFNP